MNIFFRELRADFKSLLIWSFIVILFNYVGFSKFSAYYNNPSMLAILDALPPAMLEAFSFSAFNLTTVTGFFAMMITYFALILGIAGVMWGSDIISKEERNKTVEFSLTLPVTRSKLITAKTLVVVVNSIILTLITWGITIVSSKQYSPDSEFYKFVALGVLTFFIQQMIFVAIGVFLGCAVKHHKLAGSLAISTILATYFFSVLAGLDKSMEFLKYFSPFKYFDPALLLHESRLELPYVWLSLGIIVVALAGAYFTYSRRDLYI
jgi:ABC-2 type transport system permease protein